uniref:SPRY domain-containing protein n=1 Tax=Vombatus ursinus TaxID=29139 RepID=A0A4X2MCR5_VOMUR
MVTSVFCCLPCCGNAGAGHIQLKEMLAMQMDTQHMRTDVVTVKNGRRICGTGGCLANAPLHQNKSSFELKIQSTGIWGIGVAAQKVNLNQISLALYHNNEEKSRLPANDLPQEGDVVVRFWIVNSVTFIIFLQLVLKKYYLNSKSSEYICIKNFYSYHIPPKHLLPP